VDEQEDGQPGDRRDDRDHPRQVETVFRRDECADHDRGGDGRIEGSEQEAPHQFPQQPVHHAPLFAFAVVAQDPIPKSETVPIVRTLGARDWSRRRPRRSLDARVLVVDAP
jgi:hypothetical protein